MRKNLIFFIPMVLVLGLNLFCVQAHAKKVKPGDLANNDKIANFKTDAACKRALELIVSMANNDEPVTAIKEFYGYRLIDLETKAPSDACDDLKFGISGMGQAYDGIGDNLTDGAKRLRRAGKAYDIDVSKIAPRF